MPELALRKFLESYFNQQDRSFPHPIRTSHLYLCPPHQHLHKATLLWPIRTVPFGPIKLRIYSIHLHENRPMRDQGQRLVSTRVGTFPFHRRLLFCWRWNTKDILSLQSRCLELLIAVPIHTVPSHHWAETLPSCATAQRYHNRAVCTELSFLPHCTPNWGFLLVLHLTPTVRIVIGKWAGLTEKAKSTLVANCESKVAVDAPKQVTHVLTRSVCWRWTLKAFLTPWSFYHNWMPC